MEILILVIIAVLLFSPFVIVSLISDYKQQKWIDDTINLMEDINSQSDIKNHIDRYYELRKTMPEIDGNKWYLLRIKKMIRDKYKLKEF